MSYPTRNAESLLGALVADAASLGLHWLYDVDRIANVTRQHNNSAAFVPIKAEYFEGVPGYFAHGNRKDGMFTQYGENLYLAIQHMVANGNTLDLPGLQTAFAAHFGAGGTYSGYIDRPTRGTLANIAEEKLTPSGIDDDQLPAISRVPAALLAADGSTDMQKTVEAAVRMTNNNAESVACGFVFADLLDRVLNGDPLEKSLYAASEAALPNMQMELEAALNSAEEDSVRFGAETGRACHLHMAMPLSFHILKTSGSYTEAVETNIRAGGDSAGRSILIGAVMAAVHGLGGDNGIPLSWILRMHDNAAVWAQCCALTSSEA